MILRLLLLLPLFNLAACRFEGPPVHLDITFAQPPPPATHQTLVRHGLAALFHQATGLPTAPATAVPRHRHLHLSWRDDGKRLHLEARPAQGDQGHKLTIRRSDTSRQRHASTVAFLRQVRHDFLPPDDPPRAQP